jgi:hypothetical protein
VHELRVAAVVGQAQLRHPESPDLARQFELPPEFGAQSGACRLRIEQLRDGLALTHQLQVPADGLRVVSGARAGRQLQGGRQEGSGDGDSR